MPPQPVDPMSIEGNSPYSSVRDAFTTTAGRSRLDPAQVVGVVDIASWIANVVGNVRFTDRDTRTKQAERMLPVSVPRGTLRAGRCRTRPELITLACCSAWWVSVWFHVEHEQAEILEPSARLHHQPGGGCRPTAQLRSGRLQVRCWAIQRFRPGSRAGLVVTVPSADPHGVASPIGGPNCRSRAEYRLNAG